MIDEELVIKIGSHFTHHKSIQMFQSKNDRVQVFLNDLQDSAPEKHELIQALRILVFKAHPKTTERIMYGGIMFSLGDDFGGIFPYKDHVSFEFSQGFKMKDPNKLLEGKGKFRRHLKLHSLEEVETKKASFFVEQVN